VRSLYQCKVEKPEVQAGDGVLQWWLRQDKPAPIDDVARILDRLVIMPIVKTAPRRRKISWR
jgi:hypothetical protein